MTSGIESSSAITDDRPTWDDTWLRASEVIGRRSLCDRDKVGAYIVDVHNRVVAVGYNGPPAGFEHNGTSCLSWCPRAIAGIKMWKMPVTEGLGELMSEHGKFYHRVDEDAKWNLIKNPDAFFSAMGGEPIYDLDSDYRDCPALHAEANALSVCDRSTREGGTIYVTSHSCHACCKLIANSGLARLVVRPRQVADHRRSDSWYVFLRTCGVTVDIIE